MKKFFQDFKKFISRGNIVDMAIGVIIGSAFSSIVTSLTNKILMPLINALLAMGGNGLESAYTFLVKGYTDGELDLTKCIYIDWGAFITAIINFFLIAMVLFIIMKAFMSARGFLNKQEVLTATAELREKNKPAPAPAKPTQEQLLASILEELKKQNAQTEKTE